MTISTLIPSAPVVVTLVDDGDLSVAGLGALMAPFGERVRLVDNRSALAHPEDLDVILYEPMQQSSMNQALLRDLLVAAQARAAVYSWMPTGDVAATNPHLSKTLTASQLVVALEKLSSEHPDQLDELVDEAAVTKAAEPVEPAADLNARREPSPAEAAGLTPREADIVTRIVAGLSNREISEELVLSVNSVKTYIRSAYRKMGVDRRTQAVLWGLEHGFADTSSAALVG